MTTSRERCAVCDFPLATEADDAVLDKAAVQARQSLDDIALFSDVLCWSSYTGAHREGGELADGVKHWRARALEAEAQRDELMRLCDDQRTGVTASRVALAEAELAATEKQRDAAEARVEALEGALREWARVVSGFRFGIESSRSADEADTVLLTFARNTLPGVPPKPAPRPDATEALRVAMEALEGLLSHLGDPMELEDLCGHDFDSAIDYERARSQVMAENRARAALDLLRAHVEPTPLETAVQAHTEKETP